MRPAEGGGYAGRMTTGSWRFGALGGLIVFATLACGGEDTTGSGAGSSAGGSDGGSGGATGGSGGTGGSATGGSGGNLPHDPRTIVTWRDNSNGAYDVYLKELVDDAWVDVGSASADGTGISGGVGDSHDPAIALDAEGSPFVAWTEHPENAAEQIYVKRFDGSAWVSVGSGSDSGGGISDSMAMSGNPAIALDAEDNPIVAYIDNSSGLFQVYVLRWDGSAWTEMGSGSASGTGISNTPAHSYYPALGLDGAGGPIVVWGGSQIYVLRFDGTAWMEVGTGSGSAGGISNTAADSHNPSLAFDAAGQPVVAWEDDSTGTENIYIRRFDGSAWVEVGANSATGPGITNSSVGSYRPQVLVSAADVFTVIYDFRSGNNTYYLGEKQFDGSAWTPLDMEGISMTPGWTLYPAAVLDADDQPMAVYQDEEDGGASEIHVRRWDGADWSEIGGTSASNGGLSNNPGSSGRPDIARR
jgi:hypothetical protein